MCILCQMSPVYFFLLFPQQNCFFFWNTLNADFRLKCAPLFSLLPSFFLFLALLCYLLPIGLTLAHCSLAFCQTWFLTPASSFFSSFSCAVMAVSPFPHSSFSFSHQSCRICMWVQEKIHRGSHFPVSSELLPSFLLTFLSLLWECFLSEIKVSYEPISHIPAKHTHTYTYAYTGIVAAAPVQATVKEQKYTNTETIDFSVIKQTHTSVCWRSVCSRRTIRTQSHISTLPLSIEQVRETKVEMRGKTE